MSELAIGPSLAVALRILVAYVLFQYVLKRVAGKDRRTDRFLHQYLFAVLISSLAVWAFGTITLDATFLGLALLGFVATGGTFFSWKAVAISQSRNALFTFWDDLIAMSLSYIVLREGEFLSPLVAAGIVMSLLSLVLFIRHGYAAQQKGESGHVPLVFYVYVFTYSACWGVAVFGQRYWSFHAESPFDFAFGWYVGGLVLALLLWFFYRDGDQDQQSHTPFSWKDVSAHFLLAAGIYSSLVLASISYRAPQILVQPIFLVAEMILPALMGLFIFHERKSFERPEWFYLALGLFGATCVAVNL